MRILINAASAHMGGAVTYLRYLLPALTAAGDHHVIVYLPAATRDKLLPDVAGPGVELVEYPFRSTAGAARLYFDQVVIPSLLVKHRADVLVSATGFGTLRSPRPQLLLIRNALPFVQRSGGIRQRVRHQLQRTLSLRSMHAADGVLFPSDYMRQLALGDTPPTARTPVIHYGFDAASFFRDTPMPPVIETIRRLKHEGYAILLFVSSYASHKNFETVIEALAQLRQRGVRVKFVNTLTREHTGEPAAYDRLMERATTLGVRDDLLSMGYVPYGQLSWVYRSADVFVFPSALESFGHPMLEAMAAGLPTVAADTPISREICDDAAVYFPTFNAEACARMIETVIADTGLRATLGRAATVRSAQFSWSDYGRRFGAVLEGLVGSTASSTR